jgi:adenine-specific DNA-methyltransferase
MFGADGLKLLKKNGYLNFIAPNNWVTNAGASKFRNFILQNAKIKELVDFGSFMVFDTASIQTMIMLFKKTKEKQYRFNFKRITSNKPTIDDAISLLRGYSNGTNEILQPVIKTDNLLDTNLTFSSSEIDLILDRLIEKSNFILNEKEVANGIHPHHDFVNKKIALELNDSFKVGDGIFGLSEAEKHKLKLTEKELELVKPYFNSEQFFRYCALSKNEYWLIYTSSKFKNPNEILPYPNIKKHLDQFQSVITSDNKPYGLHRTRVEDFFIGEKIIVQRKCPYKPIFTYTDFDSYVSATFYVIKTSRLNQKYLTGLLNSTLIEFWLKHKGKMQGNNFQIDKGPLLELPLIEANTEVQNEISRLVAEIISLKHQSPAADTTALENQIDQLVYELYGLTEEEVGIVEGG